MEESGDFIFYKHGSSLDTSVGVEDSSIDVASYYLLIEAVDPLCLPSYKGSTFRGGFGMALKKIACKTGDAECSSCMEYRACPYIYIFNTPPPPETEMMRLYDAAPHPFILEPPFDNRRFFQPGDHLAFGLSLLGRGIEHRDLFWDAFEEMGKTGIGKGKGRFKICGIRPAKGDAETADAGQEAELREDVCIRKIHFFERGLERDNGGGRGQISLNFLTPTRIQIQSRPITDIPFHALIRSLLRRASLLYYFHGGGDPSAWDFHGWIERATPVRQMKCDLHWYDWERYSSRQAARMSLGGVVGEVEFDGDIGPFLPLLRAGEILHVGKGTAFGLGKYTVAPFK